MTEITSRVAELSQRVDDLKVPPHSMEAEQSVIGGLMLAEQARDVEFSLPGGNRQS